MTPDEFTISEQFLDVGDGHQLYIQDWGNQKALKPVIFLHGGPGSQVKDKHKNVFDPELQRVIFFDQRGCGRSLPYGSLEHNTTQDLVADIERVADHLKLNQFIVTGGSWGSCLALAYALKHPHRVLTMVLHGIFTGSKAEIEWLDKGRFQTFFPDVWDIYLAATPKKYQKDPSSYHFRQIMGNDPALMIESGHAYESLEGAVMSLDDRFTPEPIEDFDSAGIRLEVTYMANGCYLPDRYILDNAHKLKMPVHLVQGRYDAVCPPVTAYELHKRLPNSWLTWTVSGHSTERESWSVIRTLLLQATGAI